MISTRSSITIVLLASCLGWIAVGCNKSVSSNPAPPVPSQTTTVERDRTNPEAPPESQIAPPSQALSSEQNPPVPQQLQKGMSYDEARQVIINAGWQPIPTTTDNPLDGTANWRKRGYHEVEACSGTGMGFCRFEFAGGRNRKLVVVTAGRDSSLHHWSEEIAPVNSARD